MFSRQGCDFLSKLLNLRQVTHPLSLKHFLTHLASELKSDGEWIYVVDTFGPAVLSSRDLFDRLWPSSGQAVCDRLGEGHVAYAVFERG